MAEDSRSTWMTTMAPAVHLVVLTHGLWGRPENLSLVQDVLLTHAGSMGTALPLRMLNSTANHPAPATLDGIDVCGERLVALVKEEVDVLYGEGYRAVHLSFIGYSLGGLMARYAVGKLEHEGYFSDGTCIPMNFVTVATPHLGTYKRPSGLFTWTFNRLVPVVASWTGHQLSYKDRHAGGRPLLIILSDPALPFFRGLSRFPRLILLANIHHDHGVPYWTAAISLEDPYRASRSLFGTSRSQPAADPVLYPSVRRPYSSLQGAAWRSEEQAEMAGSGDRIAVLSLLPVAIPLVVYGICKGAIKGRKHYKALAARRPDHSWVTARQEHDPGMDEHEQSPVTKEECQAAAGPVTPDDSLLAVSCSTEESGEVGGPPRVEILL